MSLSIKPHNSVYVRVQSDDLALIQRLSKRYTFYLEHARYIRNRGGRYKNWNGQIRLLKSRSGVPYYLLYQGLLYDTLKWAESEGEQTHVDPNVLPPKDSIDKIDDFLDSLALTDVNRDLRDYQYDGVLKCLRYKRAVILSPTGSGKSLIIYCVARYWQKQHGENGNLLIVVPTKNLVEQLHGDFADYSEQDTKWNANDEALKLYKGDVDVIERNEPGKIVISTWQSIHKLPPVFFKQFHSVIVDECHHSSAKSITSIMTKADRSYNRIGFTGTLNNKPLDEATIIGLFGPKITLTSSRELIDREYLANIEVKIDALAYSNNPEMKLTYHDEIEWIISQEARNEHIASIINNTKGNVLVLFRYIEKHGEPMQAVLSRLCPDRNIMYVTGASSIEERETVRKTIDSDASQRNNIIMASDIFTTGVNIELIDNIILASPTKSQIKLLQSIGRGLRKCDNKKHLVVYDIIDNLGYTNYTLKHGKVRVSIYEQQKFPINFNEICIINNDKQ